MKSRMLKMVGAMILVVLALGSLKFFQIRAAMAEYAGYQPPPEAVTTVVAGVESWPSTLRSIGTAAAVQGVTVSADLPGIVERGYRVLRVVRRDRAGRRLVRHVLDVPRLVHTCLGRVEDVARVLQLGDDVGRGARRRDDPLERSGLEARQP